MVASASFGIAAIAMVALASITVAAIAMVATASITVATFAKVDSASFAVARIGMVASAFITVVATIAMIGPTSRRSVSIGVFTVAIVSVLLDSGRILVDAFAVGVSRES